MVDWLVGQFTQGPIGQKSIQWKVDVSSLYDISDYVSPYIKQVKLQFIML